MNMEQRPGSKNNNQIEIDFSEKKPEEIRDEIAKEYGVTNPETITQKDGQWYIGSLTLSEYEEIHSKDDTKYTDI